MTEPRWGGKKRRTIQSILRRKFDDFCKSIDDEEVRNAVADNSVITGGAIASMLLGESVSDYDVYFTSLRTTELAANYFVKKFTDSPPKSFRKKHGDELPKIYVRIDESSPPRVKVVVQSAGVASENNPDNYEYFEGDVDPESISAAEYAEQVTAVAEESASESGPKYRPVFLSGNAISLSNKVQVVIRFYGNPDEIHQNYDFVHCTNYWISKTGQLVLRPEAIEALLSKDLRYVGSKYPLCSLIRTRKFVARKWTINAGQYLKMAWQLNELDLSDPLVLQEQLTGVDAAYFDEIIRLLRNRMEETGEKKVDQTYLMELIDRMF